MKLLATLSVHYPFPKGYVDRPTVKAVVMNDRNEVLLFGGGLLGGGVEEGETFEVALHRECLEEAGITIQIQQSLGEVHQYRDALKKCYKIQGFLSRYKTTVSAPTTVQKREQGRLLTWMSLNDAIQQLEKEIYERQQEKDVDTASERYQSSVYNRMAAVFFLREVDSFLTIPAK